MRTFTGLIATTLACILLLAGTEASTQQKSDTLSEIQTLLDVDMGPRYTMPSVPTTTVDGQQVKCLSTSDWKTVLLITNAFHGLYDWRLEVHSILRAQADIITAYELKISSYEASLKIHESDRDYLTTRLDKEKDWALKLEKSKGVEIMIWKITAGLELAAIVATSIVIAVKD
jgi:hypothetical protein